MVVRFSRPRPQTLRAWSIVVAVLVPVAVQAADAKGRVLHETDLYSGPGRYPILRRLARGDGIKLISCLKDRSWCQVESDKDLGWISVDSFELTDKKGHHLPTP